MLKRTMLLVALPMLALAFVLTPTASAGWFSHNGLEHHERSERNRSRRNSYADHNTDRFAYYDNGRANSHIGVGYGENFHGGLGYYNKSENHGYASRNYHNGRDGRDHVRQH